MVILKKLDMLPITLCHYAMRTWNMSHYGALHFFGHSHGNLQGDSQSCDVGVDCWGFVPVSLDQVKERMQAFPRRIEPDHHQPHDANRNPLSAVRH
jgi:calcineurin-like phosphoesterase family protein